MRLRLREEVLASVGILGRRRERKKDISIKKDENCGVMIVI